MLYFASKNKFPLIHVSSGKLLSNGNFIHPNRKLDTFVIIVCINGTLNIAQGDARYTLKENQFILLFANFEHFGFMESKDELSYYWCHFKVENDDFRVLNSDEISSLIPSSSQRMIGLDEDHHFSQYYILPEHGELHSCERAFLVFRQLLDLARINSYSNNLPSYALSLLAMEISQEYIEARLIYHLHNDINPNMEKVVEWVRINYNLKLSAKEIAKLFNYNPDYLSTAFRKYMGVSLMKYIAMIKISMAKRLLLNTNSSIKTIATEVGFNDEKAFMKRFKVIEDITPTEYRNSFYRTKIIKQ